MTDADLFDRDVVIERAVVDEKRIISTEIPHKLGFLLELHPYKVAYGGRHGLKTRSFAKALLFLGLNQKLRILCCREVMNSLRESVHEELKAQIEELGLGGHYRVLDNEIRGSNGTLFFYAGLSIQTAESIKSFANVDIAWVEEAQGVQKRSWDLLIPTIRAKNSEIWVSFNPEMDSDDTWVRFVEQPPPGAIVVRTGWQDAAALGWFPETENQKRIHLQRTQPDDYDNIWGGKPRTVVAGAIYTREVLSLIEEKRYRPVPYNPMLPVDTIWDLGWNDAMAVIMVQKPSPNTLNIINYREDVGRRYDEIIGDLEQLHYRWGFDWLPHDAEQHHPTSGTNAKKTLIRLRRNVKIIAKSNPEARIRAARTMFPTVYIDNTSRKCTSGYLGAARLVDCLKRYKRNVPKTTGEPTGPVHDAVSHACDAYGGLAEIVAQIRGEFETPPPPPLAPFTQPQPGLGMLG